MLSTSQDVVSMQTATIYLFVHLKHFVLTFVFVQHVAIAKVFQRFISSFLCHNEISFHFVVLGAL